jgi:hypothetical protein
MVLIDYSDLCRHQTPLTETGSQAYKVGEYAMRLYRHLMVHLR